MEVELKLAARSEDLPGLKRALMTMARVSTQERLTSTYYDTPDSALKERGLTLRVRDQGGHFLQTVKEGDAASGDLLSRGEWEDAVAGGRPDPDAAQSGPRLPEGAAAHLRPFFVTEVTRTIFAIEPLAGTAIEAAIDEGEIRAVEKNRAEPISEVELELKSGDATTLYDLAARLLEVAPLRIETRSKSERGYHLLEGGDASPPPVHAEPVILDPEMTVKAALQKIGRSCLAQLLRNEPAVLSAQPEGVHQMRVAVRRLRSAISSLKKLLPQEDVQWVSEELRWLGGTLGPARNLDVFAAELVPTARAGLPDEPGWEDLAAILDRLRAAAYDQIREAILSRRYTASMLRLLRWFEASGSPRHSASDEPDAMTSPICAIAPGVLDRRRRKVRQRGKGFGSLMPRERHKLRIAVKKLRYTIELFGSLFDKDGLERFVGRLKRLQSGLGYANDVRVAHEFITELFAQIEPRSPAAHAWVALLEAHDQIFASGERKLRRHRRRLNDAAPFWRN
ncbi:MAG: CYTH and CHAD domain-containing protein [Alphaproteobacteria bacterium]|nr:CYTH and CHAD domain-containing protein [Alphaproteobacteria bacterium]